MIFIKKIIHTAIRQIGKTFRLTQHIPGHHNRDKRLPIHTTNSNAIRIVVNNLYGHSSESNHYLPPFASSLIMHVLTNAEKLIPRRDAASLAESRKLAGIRIVTGTTSPFTRYERISVSPASCSIRSEYVIAFYTFKLQYKCNNSTPAWEQRKLGELSSEFQSGDFISAEEILGSGPYPVYGGNGLRGYAKQYNHDGFYALIGRQGALCGNVNTAVGKAYFTEHAVAVKANFLHDTRFLAHLLGCMDLGRYSGQSAQPGLAVGVLKEVETTVPSKAEQQAIGSFFSRLDSLITLHQRKRLSIRQRSPVWS